MTIATRIDASTYLSAVDGQMLRLVDAHDGPVAAAARRIIGAGGKRFRPLLVLVACSSHAADRLDDPGQDLLADAAVRAGAAVELVHTASLVHDDLLDHAPLRRGTPTVGSTDGRAVAVAAGDLLFSLAFTSLVSCRGLLGEERVRHAVAALAEASRELAEGEALQARQLRDPHLQEQAYLERCAGKTGVLFGAALRIGAALAGADHDDVTVLGEFGTVLGTAFQVADDVLDCAPADDADVLGKLPGADLRDGTITLPMIHAVLVEPELASQLRAGVADQQVDAVLHRIRATGALEHARARAHQLQREAVQLLAGLEHRFDTTALEDLARRAVARIA